MAGANEQNVLFQPPHITQTRTISPNQPHSLSTPHAASAPMHTSSGVYCTASYGCSGHGCTPANGDAVSWSAPQGDHTWPDTALKAVVRTMSMWIESNMRATQ
jgi:hypothetical protein